MLKHTIRGEQLKIGYMLLVNERSERDRIRGGQCKIGYMYDVYGLYVCPLNAHAGTIFFLLNTQSFRLDSAFF